MARMTDAELATAVGRMIQDAEAYREAELMPERDVANDYYNGKMDDTPVATDENGTPLSRSSFISKDVRAAIKKAKPSVHRVFFGTDRIVEYQPAGEGDEETAEQATDYVNRVVLPETCGQREIKSAIHDAMLHRNGILKWWAEEKDQTETREHSGLIEPEFARLVAPDDVELLEHTERDEEIEDPATGLMVQGKVHDVKIKRTLSDRTIKLAARPLETFLIDSEACDIEDAVIVGEHIKMRRTELIEMGYERQAIMDVPDAGANTNQDTEEQSRRGELGEQNDDQLPREIREVDYYEVYVRIDQDGDGIAELLRVVMIGGLTEQYLFDNDPWDEVPFADIRIENRPHQWEGYSLYDDVREIQRVKTVLTRETLDNIYWQNSQQQLYQEGTVNNPEAITAPEFGEPIEVRAGVSINDAVGVRQIPFVGDASFAMLGYMDDQITDRTGVSEASSGLAPDALQNMTAKATGLIEQAGIGSVEDMVNTLAEGLSRAFRGLLRLIVQHQDKPRTVRLRDEWVSYDPKSWNANMDAKVNTGLGAGTRERDMAAMGFVMNLQEKILTQMGAINPFVQPDDLYNAIEKATEAAGLKSPELYFTKPTPESVAAALQAANQPDAATAKVQADAQLEQLKLQSSIAIEREKQETTRQREAAQLAADMEIKQLELRNQFLLEEQKIQLERDKIAAQMDMKSAELAQKDDEAQTEAMADVTVANIEAEAQVDAALINAADEGPVN